MLTKLCVLNSIPALEFGLALSNHTDLLNFVDCLSEECVDLVNLLLSSRMYVNLVIYSLMKVSLAECQMSFQKLDFFNSKLLF